MSYISFARLRRCGVALAFAGVLSLAAATGASAASFTANTTAELEEDVTTANGNAAENTIHLARGVVYAPSHTLSFTSTEKQTIEGPEGPSATHAPEVDGAAVEPEPSELVSLKTGSSVSFKWVDMTLGGGLAIPGVTVEENAALTLEFDGLQNMNSTAVDIHGGATATMVNSTISHTTAGLGIVDDGTAHLTNSTVAFNENGGVENAGTLSLTNSIVAENTKAGFHDCANRAASTTTHSLDSDGTCGVEHSAVNPLLREAPNFDGGPTRLQSLTPGSPAIDAGETAACPTKDQRGFARPDVAATACDIGADEYNDLANPVITASSVPAGFTTEATSASGAAVKFKNPTATTTDTEAALEGVICSRSEDSEYAVGVTEVTCTAEDGHGNKSAPVSFKVSVMKPEVTIATASLGGIATGLAVNSEHDVWVALPETNSVKEFSATGGTALLTLGAVASPCTGHLEGPFGVAVDASNNVWVVDQSDDLVREFSPAGVCSLQFGGQGSGAGQLSGPRGIAIDSHGNVWVSDTGNRRIEEFTSTGTFVRQFGAGGAEFFSGLGGLAVDSHGNVRVADVGNGRVDEFNETGAFLGSIGPRVLGGCGKLLCLPMGVAVDASGNVWVADYGHSRMDQFNEAGTLLGEIGHFGVAENNFEWPLAVAVDSSAGDVWIPDVGNTRVEKWIGADPPGGSPLTAAQLTLKKHGRSH